MSKSHDFSEVQARDFIRRTYAGKPLGDLRAVRKYYAFGSDKPAVKRWFVEEFDILINNYNNLINSGSCRVCGGEDFVEIRKPIEKPKKGEHKNKKGTPKKEKCSSDKSKKKEASGPCSFRICKTCDPVMASMSLLEDGFEVIKNIVNSK